MALGILSFSYNEVRKAGDSMTQRNFMNVNEVYPILDMINRKVGQIKRGSSHNFESPLLNDGNTLDSSQWQVESFEVMRDHENDIDPNVIKQVMIIYRNGAIDTITLTRGLTPPVGADIPDHEYINHLMIVEVMIATQYMGKYQEVIAKIFKEHGYGNFQRIELTYDDADWFVDEQPPAIDDDYENPNDFYDGGGYSSGYDSEVDEAEDYADSHYTASDEVTPPESGWADGYNPSDPTDYVIE